MGTAPAVAAKPKPHRDLLREWAETVAFVVSLVLMLKLFVVEAFVIPTGSMAETLYGYQKMLTCPDCGFDFPVNASTEVDPPPPQRMFLSGACCPNCRYPMDWKPRENPPANTGDRVLVQKAMYHLTPPRRGDVVVFKYPVDPQVDHTAQNYIKRLWGLGGDTIAINGGDLYATQMPADQLYPPAMVDLSGKPVYPRGEVPAEHLWEGPDTTNPVRFGGQYERLGPDFTYHDQPAGKEFFDRCRKAGFTGVENGFALLRKTDAQLLAMRRIVYDSRHPSKQLAQAGVPARWQAGTGWTADDFKTPKAFTHAGDTLGWVRYKHLAPLTTEDWQNLKRNPTEFGPQLITNGMGYNSGIANGRAMRPGTEYWVGDLILEADVTFGTGPVVLELSKGAHRYQAEFAGGNVTLRRTGPKGQEFGSRPTGVSGGTHAVRFANVDCTLRVWVDDRKIDFGTDADYQPDGLPEKFDPADDKQEGWVAANDLQEPAGLGASGGATVANLVLWRDTYFTNTVDFSKFSPGVAAHADTFYVQPGHYFCLGDNSAQSSDGRKWGLVPERLMLGKASFVFWPAIPKNRIGFIQ